MFLSARSQPSRRERLPRLHRSMWSEFKIAADYSTGMSDPPAAAPPRGSCRTSSASIDSPTSAVPAAIATRSAPRARRQAACHPAVTTGEARRGRHGRGPPGRLISPFVPGSELVPNARQRNGAAPREGILRDTAPFDENLPAGACKPDEVTEANARRTPAGTSRPSPFAFHAGHDATAAMAATGRVVRGRALRRGSSPFAWRSLARPSYRGRRRAIAP